jgi:nucleoside-diphosphate-sugar epimerase
MSPERAFIVGCGYVGKALAAQLRAAGVAVAGTSASGEAAIPGVAIARVDLRAPPAGGLDFGAAAEGAVVYYLVATLARQLDAARTHLGPLDAALAALARRPLAGIVYLSSTTVYGDRCGAWVDEKSPTAPDSPWGEMRVDLERRVREWGTAHATPACVVRVPEIYGPGRGPVARLRANPGRYTLRHADRFASRIHLDDLVTVLEELGRRLEPALLLACDDEPARSGEVYTLAARLLGLPAVPRAVGEEPADPNLRALARDSKRCSNARLRAWLGRPLRYPTYREGLPATL